MYMGGGGGGGYAYGMNDLQHMPITMGPGGQPLVAVPLNMPGSYGGTPAAKSRLDDNDADADADADADNDSKQEGDTLKAPKQRSFSSNNKNKMKWDSP